MPGNRDEVWEVFFPGSLHKFICPVELRLSFATYGLLGSQPQPSSSSGPIRPRLMALGEGKHSWLRCGLRTPWSGGINGFLS